MTTIVVDYENRQVAVDSRATSGRLIVSDKCNKVDKKDGVTFISCGTVADINILIQSYPEGLDVDVTLQAQSIVIDGTSVGILRMEHGECLVDPIDCNSSLGSGGDFALAAMDFGLTAKEAIKYAMTRDCATGGRIKLIKF